jgi:uncharacterized protein (DUF2147 family)
MVNRYALRFFLILAVFSLRISCYAQVDALEKNLWYNDGKTARIQIFKSSEGKFYGRIVWLKVPNRDGKPKTDIHNPNEERRNDPMLGMTILRGFKKDGETSYEDGTIYDPNNGKIYSCKMNLKGNELRVRGYIGISLIGRTAVWTKVE